MEGNMIYDLSEYENISVEEIAIDCWMILINMEVCHE